MNSKQLSPEQEAEALRRIAEMAEKFQKELEPESIFFITRTDDGIICNGKLYPESEYEKVRERAMKAKQKSGRPLIIIQAESVERLKTLEECVDQIGEE